MEPRIQIIYHFYFKIAQVSSIPIWRDSSQRGEWGCSAQEDHSEEVEGTRADGGKEERPCAGEGGEVRGRM